MLFVGQVWAIPFVMSFSVKQPGVDSSWDVCKLQCKLMQNYEIREHFYELFLVKKYFNYPDMNIFTM